MAILNRGNVYALRQRLAPKLVRSFFGFIPSKPPDDGNAKRKKFSERRLLGWSKEQLFEIVSNVDEYKEFLPACQKSHVTQRGNNWIKADLEIGFPPILVERYTSHVTLDKPTLVSARCFEGKLFEHLVTEWRFSEGIKDNPKTCTVDFKLDFQFRSALYSQLVHGVFDEMARQSMNAFMRRAQQKFGRPEFIPHYGARFV